MTALTKAEESPEMELGTRELLWTVAVNVFVSVTSIVSVLVLELLAAEVLKVRVLVTVSVTSIVEFVEGWNPIVANEDSGVSPTSLAAIGIHLLVE